MRPKLRLSLMLKTIIIWIAAAILYSSNLFTESSGFYLMLAFLILNILVAIEDLLRKELWYIGWRR